MKNSSSSKKLRAVGTMRRYLIELIITFSVRVTALISREVGPREETKSSEIILTSFRPLTLSMKELKRLCTQKSKIFVSWSSYLLLASLKLYLGR